MELLKTIFFVTLATHDGNFGGDTTVSGSNSIKKAYDFCMKHKPSILTGTYKALLVDNSNRKPLSSEID